MLIWEQKAWRLTLTDKKKAILYTDCHAPKCNLQNE
uniref:Uncharacterized protein n=1 Tax=Anguilla anguilla TaxID=7936 RepID=A0A0E9RHK0_ANGAN